MMNTVDQVARQFTSGELVQVAECIGLSPTSRWGSKKLTESVLAYVSTSGVPKLAAGKEHAGLVEEFLYVAGLVDKSGTVQEVTKEQKQELVQFMEEKGIKVLPDCYGYWDTLDPACKKCKLGAYCAEERLSNLPPCFGLLFDAVDLECKKCFEAPQCKPS